MDRKTKRKNWKASREKSGTPHRKKVRLYKSTLECRIE